MKSIKLLAIAVALLTGCPLLRAAPTPTVLLRDTFDANTANTTDLNVDLARQSGTKAPLEYSMAVGPAHYGHQLQNVNAPNQLLVADFPNSTSSLNFNFNGANSAGGLKISFDLDSVPTVYGGTPDNWGCINLGASQTDQLVNVNGGQAHFGILFRAAGTLQAFDGAAVVSPNPEPVYTTSPAGTTNHIDLVISDADGNPFDGLGSTIIEVFVNGGALPVWTFTKGGGGYANNYINLQGSFRAHFDNLTIAQLPANSAPELVNPSFEADTFTVFPGYVSGNGPITGWTALGGHGVNPGTFGGPFTDNGAIPDGTKAAFLQEDGAIRQVITGLSIGANYQIRYFENARNGTAPSAEVKIGTTTIVSAHAVPPVGGAAPYREVLSDVFAATSSAMELSIIKSNPLGGDTTLLIDNVSVVAPGTPPTITAQPRDAVVALGDTVILSVAASGSAPLSYQWYFGSDPIFGATSPTLSVLVDFPDAAGDYRVTVSNPSGMVTSRTATISVRDVVAGLFNTGVDDSGVALADGAIDSHYKIVVNPDSASPDATVENSGAFPIAAGPWVANNPGSKWIGPRFDTAGAAGAVGTGGDYVYRTILDLGGYDPATVIVTGVWATDNEGSDILINGQSTGQRNTIGFTGLTPFTINSGFVAGLNSIEFKLNNSAVGYTGLRVDQVRVLGNPLPAGTRPFIITQPQGATLAVGQTANFSVQANGSAPLSYQWYYGPDAIPNATGPTLSVFIEFADAAGDYSVEITNPFGSIRSSAATLVVLAEPVILTQPQSQVAVAGDSVTFNVSAIGEPPLTYQWIHNNQDIPGANDTNYVIASVTAADAGNYAVRISNLSGTTTSVTATLTLAEVVPGLFNTGVDASGSALPDNTVDPHYTLVVNPDSASPNTIVEDSTVFPIVAGPWVANEADSKWIGPRFETSAAAGGDYVYRQTFSLAGINPATVRITGEWSTDNAGIDISINGTSTGLVNSGQFVTYTAFTITSGFQAGENTLEFRVNNADVGYTGLRVRKLRATGVPSSANQAPSF
ncbi:MAG TPA: immunoglobulin domain-containing protein, partial [Verrucomicrobiae bacterium]|nr:immunoglobulin domain-containing protein [Verrucomicrobiae bacterium]